MTDICFYCQSQWPRGLRRRSAADRLLSLWVRIPPAAWIFVCCECRVLSGRGLYDELITRPEESYWLCCVVVWPRNLLNEEALVRVASQRHKKKENSWFQTFALLWMLYAFFWVIPRRINFICRRFGTLCLFHLHRRISIIHITKENPFFLP
jgi:hypothetical protein